MSCKQFARFLSMMLMLILTVAAAQPERLEAGDSFGSAYVNDPVWTGSCTIANSVVHLVTNQSNLLTKPLIYKRGTNGMQYLIEQTKLEDRYRPYICRRTE